jgi:hypothetical protein
MPEDLALSIVFSIFRLLPEKSPTVVLIWANPILK